MGTVEFKRILLASARMGGLEASVNGDRGRTSEEMKVLLAADRAPVGAGLWALPTR